VQISSLPYLRILVPGVLVFLVSTICLGQLSSNVDSLQDVLQTETNDLHRLAILNAIGYTYARATNDSALVYGEEALALATKLNDEKGKVYALMTLGMVDGAMKKFKEAAEKYDYAVSYFEKMQDTLGLARISHKYGTLYFRQKARHEGIQYYLKAISFYQSQENRYPAESREYALIELAKITDAATWAEDYAMAKTYALQYLNYARQTSNTKREANAWFYLGNIDYDRQVWAGSIPNYEKSLEVFGQFRDQWSEAEINDIISVRGQLGIAYRNIGDLEKAKRHLKVAEVMLLHQQNFPPQFKYLLFQNLGICYLVQEKYDSTLYYFLSNLDMAEQLNNKGYLAETHMNLGSMLYSSGEIENAEKHLEIAMNMYAGSDNQHNLAIIYYKLGLIKQNRGDSLSAVEQFQKMREIGESLQDTDLLVVAYTNLMLMNADIPDYELAGNIFRSQVKVQEGIGKTEHTMHVYRFAGICFLKSGSYQEAIEYFEKSLALAKSLNLVIGMQLAYNNLKNVYIEMGDYEAALVNSERENRLMDSVNTVKNVVAITEIKTRYDTEKKEKEIIRLQSEKKISALELQYRDESIKRIRVEKDQVDLQNQNNLQVMSLMTKDKQIQGLMMDSVIYKTSQDSLSIQLMQASVAKQKLIKNLSLAGLGFFILLLALGYSNYQTRQHLKMQTLRNKIASDLHDDVGSTLSSISIFSQIAQRQSEDIQPLLNTIEESSRKMLDAMADIVWTINPENDQFEKIILRMRNFAFDLLGARNIHFEFISDDHIADLKIPMELRKNLYLIFKEATNNMVKYSGADQARFTLREEKDMLTMEIRDNGNGFDPLQEREGNGLRNMKKRAEEIGGKLLIESKLNEGTMVRLNVAV
jgi:two-component system sensor histidine kinase UhpB